MPSDVVDEGVLYHPPRSGQYFFIESSIVLKSVESSLSERPLSMKEIGRLMTSSQLSCTKITENISY